MKAQKTIKPKKSKKILEDFPLHSNNGHQEDKNEQIKQESTSEQKSCPTGKIKLPSIIPQQHKIKVTYQKQKNKTPGQLAKNTQNQPDLSETNTKISRHIPVAQKLQALAQSNHKCSYPNFNGPPEVFHHPQRFGKTPNHQDLKPLCKPHHEFMHNGLVANEIQVTSCWELSLSKDITIEDELYRQYREKALD